MSQFFSIHPENPQARLITQAAEILRAGGVIAYPTDSSYALGCLVDSKEGRDRIAQIRAIGKDHNFTLVVRDLSEIASYAKVDNVTYRFLKAHTPGAFTFILPATREVPRRLQHPKKKTIGLRIPDNRIARELCDALGEPLLSSTLFLPGEDLPMTEPWAIREDLEHALDLVIDGGYCGIEPTTVVDLCDGEPQVLRQGLGTL